MVRFSVKANPSGQYYFPKEVREEIGRDLYLICGVRTVLLFPKTLELANVIKSIDLIKAHLEIELQHESSKC